MPIPPSTEKYTNGGPHECFWLLAIKEETRITKQFEYYIGGFAPTLERVQGAHSRKRLVNVFHEKLS